MGVENTTADSINLLSILVVSLMGGLAAVLANQSIAVFNDGLRPIIPQYLDGTMNRKTLAATSFALCFGLVVGFGIPISIGASILVVHSIFLATDIIGTWFSTSKKGMIGSALVGAAWGVLLLVGLEFVVSIFALMPYNFLDSLGKVGDPIVIAFAAFPAVVVALQFGFKQGTITFIIEFITLMFFTWFNSFLEASGSSISLSVPGMTMLVGMVILLVMAMRVKDDGKSSNTNLVDVFAGKVSRIKSYQWVLAFMGGLVAAGTSLLIVAGDPVSQELLVEGNYNDAAFAAFARAIGFIPLIFSTAIVSGVYGPAGCTFVFVIGILCVGSPLLAFALGFLMILVEVNLITFAAKGMDKFPGIRDMGENIRTAMSKVLELALLIGGAIACEAIAPGIGYFWLIGAYILNTVSKKPISKMAVGPIAAIALGIVMNVMTSF